MVSPPDNTSLYKSQEGYQEVLRHYGSTLQRMDIPFETTYVETSFGPTFAILTGHEGGKPVVLWHGLNANASTWANWIPKLASSFHIYAIDTIGSMGKSAASRPSKKGSDYGLWAAETLEGLGVEKANMIGASNGGWLILKLGNIAPERIGCTVLMSSAGFLSLSMMQVLRMMPKILFKPPDEIARQTLESISPPGLPPDPFTLELLELMAKHFRPEQIPPALSDEEMKRFCAPTYVLMGQYETSFDPYAAIKRGVDLLPNVITAEIVPEVGHSMIHRNPDWVIGRVLRFIEENVI